MPRINELPNEPATPDWDDEIPFYDKSERLTNKITVGKLAEAINSDIEAGLAELVERTGVVEDAVAATDDTVAGLVDDPGSATGAALAAQFAPIASGLLRTYTKLTAGQDITIAFVGDSILEGNTADTPGTDDAASIVCATLSQWFDCTVTKSNLAVSGNVTWNALVAGTKFHTALATADLIIVSFGHNDRRSDAVTGPGIGYAKENMQAAYEHMTRRVRRVAPDADIAYMLEPPYEVASTSLNDLLEAQNVLIEALADDYGVTVIDSYSSFTALGDWDALITSAHPNSAGHALMATDILAEFPVAANPPAAVSPAIGTLPAYTNVRASRYGTAGWTEVTSEGGTTARTLRFLASGAGWAAQASSTPGTIAGFQFFGSEGAIHLSCGAGTGVVDIRIDGALVHNDLDLTAYASGTRKLPIVDLTPGPHRVEVIVVSGTITVHGVSSLQSTALDIHPEDASITYVGSWAGADRPAGWSARRYMSSTVGNYMEFTFVGTGVLVQGERNTNAKILDVSVDGGAADEITAPAATSPTTYGTYFEVTGLDYGEHTVRATIVNAGGGIGITGIGVIGHRQAP